MSSRVWALDFDQSIPDKSVWTRAKPLNCWVLDEAGFFYEQVSG
jgi:hypothetical protein